MSVLYLRSRQCTPQPKLR